MGMNPNGTVAAIICARSSSNRLPDKVLAKTTDDWTMLEQCIWRLKMAQSVRTIVVATTHNEEDDRICRIAQNLDVKVYRGCLDNVVARMWEAYMSHGEGAPFIYRAMSDQPFMDWEALDRSTALMLEHKWDTVVPLAFKEDPVYGAGVAPWSFFAFNQILQCSTGDELEHVGMWLKRNLDKFKYGLVDLPHWCYRPYRLEVDTLEDLNFARAVHDGMDGGFKPLRTIIRHLDINPRLTEINSHIEEKTGTYTSFTDAEIVAWHKDYVGRPIVWSDLLGLVGTIEKAKQVKYKCPECNGALVALQISKGDLELECIQCTHKKKYYSAKPKKGRG